MEYRLFRWINQQDLTLPTDLLVQKATDWLNNLSDQDLIEILMTGFIPDTYDENKKEEKAFSKVMEVLVAIVFERIGFTTTIMKSKSETEDIRITNDSVTIVVDVKTFRLGRSQLAPNVKDFVKLHTIRKWIDNFNHNREDHQAIGGLVVYPSTHEWRKASQVYRECSTKETPIVMLSYEILAALLQYKNHFQPKEMLGLWNFKSLFPKPVSNRQEYWNIILPVISELCGEETNFIEELDLLRLYYEEIIQEAVEHLVDSMSSVSKLIPKQVERMSKEALEKAVIHLLMANQVNPLQKSLQNIEKFRISNEQAS